MYINDNKLYFDDEKNIKRKKITGHSFVQLICKDKFNKPGDAVINLIGLGKSQIDPFYTNRGALAEQIVQKVYSREHNIEVNPPKTFDNFTDNDTFGGAYDILANPKNSDEKFIVEVKSKSIKDYAFFDNNNHDNEILQGYYYAKLLNLKSFVMEWIFFDEQMENEIKECKKITTFKNIKRKSIKYYVEEIEMENGNDLLDKAKNFYDNCYNYKYIPIEFVSEKILQNYGITIPQQEFDLPF